MPETPGDLAGMLARHLTERDYDQGCALRCGYDGDDRAAHLARVVADWLRAEAQVEAVRRVIGVCPTHRLGDSPAVIAALVKRTGVEG